MFDESDKVNAYVKQKNIGMKIDYSGKARRALKDQAPQEAADDESQMEELDGASRAMRRIIQQKLLNGDELMADEMRFLKRSDTGLYTKARTAQDARERMQQEKQPLTWLPAARHRQQVLLLHAIYLVRRSRARVGNSIQRAR